MQLSSKIQFCDEKTKKLFESLETENFGLYCNLLKAFSEIEKNAFCGIRIPKRLMPHDYVVNYNIHNLWKYNLPNAFRLLYSVESDGVLVLAIILEWFNHKNYERKFNY